MKPFHTAGLAAILAFLNQNALASADYDVDLGAETGSPYASSINYHRRIDALPGRVNRWKG
jgi:hypothetical protein